MKTLNDFLKECEQLEEDAPIVTTTSAGGPSGAMKGDWVNGNIKKMISLLRRRIKRGK